MSKPQIVRLLKILATILVLGTGAYYGIDTSGVAEMVKPAAEPVPVVTQPKSVVVAPDAGK